MKQALLRDAISLLFPGSLTQQPVGRGRACGHRPAYRSFWCTCSTGVGRGWGREGGAWADQQITSYPKCPHCPIFPGEVLRSEWGGKVTHYQHHWASLRPPVTVVLLPVTITGVLLMPTLFFYLLQPSPGLQILAQAVSAQVHGFLTLSHLLTWALLRQTTSLPSWSAKCNDSRPPFP